MIKKLFLIKQAILFTARIFISSASGGENCIVCSKKSLVIPICKNCIKKYFSVSDINKNICKVCGKKLISEISICTQCRQEATLKHTDGVFPIYSYRLWNIELMHRWKFNKERCISPFFAEILKIRINQLKQQFGSFIIVPVPPRAGKIRKEGWDQIEELCCFLEYKYGLKIMRILERKIGLEQKHLNKKERQKSALNSYRLKTKINNFLPPGKVCIIDDVITTGATIESCASVLKEAGVKTVYAAGLFSVE